MENTLFQLLRKPISTLSSAERNLCFKHIGVEIIDAGAYLGASVISALWLPTKSKITLSFNYKTNHYLIKTNEKSHSYKVEFTIEQLEKTLREIEG
jgi:hypothetical protein